ncbi:hypothetical protein TNCT_7101 [Trichonephila clavata]|uniref:Uncharacterized protein n=1 Tax=Trichonephila clavata TaxID=2740835 RepID=A0A8X6GYX7_TRICU|nr:hypothetical protein TNCT_7101 [Trichonephila clavata]
MTVDVLLISDIFENFRTLCQIYDKIDPCDTYAAHGLAWQACLKMTKVRLELLTHKCCSNSSALIQAGCHWISPTYQRWNYRNTIRMVSPRGESTSDEVLIQVDESIFTLDNPLDETSSVEQEQNIQQPTRKTLLYPACNSNYTSNQEIGNEV